MLACIGGEITPIWKSSWRSDLLATETTRMFWLKVMGAVHACVINELDAYNFDNISSADGRGCEKHRFFNGAVFG